METRQLLKFLFFTDLASLKRDLFGFILYLIGMKISGIASLLLPQVVFADESVLKKAENLFFA